MQFPERYEVVIVFKKLVQYFHSFTIFNRYCVLYIFVSLIIQVLNAATSCTLRRVVRGELYFAASKPQFLCRDPSWNIKDYLLKLLKSLKTWRRVYWRLWGDAHFLFCTTCNKYFPAHQIGWCRYHPDSPQFFTVETQKAPLPIGRYPCCGDRAYRFQLLDNQAGCKFREHTPCANEVRDAAVVNMLEMYRHLVEEEPPELMFPERLTRLVARGICLKV